MTEAVTKVALAINEPGMIAGMEGDPNVVPHIIHEEAPVIVVSQATSPEDVEVLVMLPTSRAKVKAVLDGHEQVGNIPENVPVTVKFSLDTFLNTARMLAMQHGAVVGQPEAMTDDNVPPKIITPGGV